MKKRLPELNLPRPHMRTNEQGQVYDELRHQWVALTPEEWVRQHAIHYLREVAGVPSGLMAVEKGHASHAGPRRTDIHVFDRRGNSWMLVECKRPTVSLAQASLDQVVRYALSLAPEYVVVTNGLRLFAAKVNQVGGYDFVHDFPLFPANATGPGPSE